MSTANDMAQELAITRQALNLARESLDRAEQLLAPDSSLAKRNVESRRQHCKAAVGDNVRLQNVDVG